MVAFLIIIDLPVTEGGILSPELSSAV